MEDMVNLCVEVEALNMEEIKQNLLKYLEEKTKTSITTDSTTDISQSLEQYYTKTQTDAMLNNKQNTSALTTTLNASSTDEQYPSAKCVYDIIGDVEELLSEV